MLSLSASSRLFASVLAAAGLVVVLAQPPAARAWGNGGHRLINKLAASTLPADVPAFLRSPEAVAEIEYLGPEPDRWRSPAEPELSAAQAPEHFIDLEPADALGPLPHRRLDFEAMVFASGQRPEKIGLQPWETTEVWERLKAALREYRKLAAGDGDTRPVEQAILFYAGWLGHYVGDGSQPRTWPTCGNRRPMWRGSTNWTRREGSWARERPSRGSLPPDGWLPGPACCAT